MLIILLVILLIIYFYWKEKQNYKTYESQHGKYKLLNISDSYSAFKLIDKVSEKGNLLLSYLQHDINKHKFNSLNLSRARLLLTNYNSKTLIEHDPTGNTETSFTINKGDFMHLCLRYDNIDTPDNNNILKLHEFSTIWFVYLHEMAHIANEKYGHGRDYWLTFRWLLEYAQSKNLYFNQNFEKKPVLYCGLIINYQPLNDANLCDNL